MNNILVFESSIDISDTIYSILNLILPLFIFLILKIKLRHYKDSRIKLLNFIFIFFLLGVSVAVFKEVTEYYYCYKAIKNNSYKIVRGKISNFDPMFKDGHKLEKFTVKNIDFYISYTGNYPDKKTLFYTLTKTHNGPIQHNGQYVIIYYISIFGDNKIIKMFLAR